MYTSRECKRGKSRSASAGDLLAILETLEAAYGSPRHGNPTDPLDDLIYLKLSQQTNVVKFAPVYEALRGRGWDWVADASEVELAGELRYLGFHRQRAGQLRAMLARIRADRGTLDLAWLRGAEPSVAIEYLQSLPGVGVKTAYCVAMYTLGAAVLPVDTHVGRVSARLGLVPEAGEYKGGPIHRALEEMIPPERRYGFHVNAVAHGRACCTTTRPKCGMCPLASLCAFFLEGRNQGKPSRRSSARIASS